MAQKTQESGLKVRHRANQNDKDPDRPLFHVHERESSKTVVEWQAESGAGR